MQTEMKNKLQFNKWLQCVKVSVSVKANNCSSLRCTVHNIPLCRQQELINCRCFRAKASVLSGGSRETLYCRWQNDIFASWRGSVGKDSTGLHHATETYNTFGEKWINLLVHKRGKNMMQFAYNQYHKSTPSYCSNFLFLCFYCGSETNLKHGLRRENNALM